MIVLPWKYRQLEKIFGLGKTDQRSAFNVVPIAIYAIASDEFTEKVTMGTQGMFGGGGVKSLHI